MKLNNRKNQEVIKKVIIMILLLLFTFVVSLTLHSNPFSQSLPNHDSSMFQYFGYAMDNGKTMYTEIFDHKGPMIFILNYLGILLSTESFQGVYLLEYISLFVYFLFSYKTIHLWLNKLLSFILVIPHGIILMFFLQGGNLTEEYALPFIAISLYIFSKYFKDANTVNYFEIIFLGFASAVVFSLRANMVVIWLAFCFVIFIKKVIEKEYETLLHYTLLFSLGLLLFFIPMGLYLYINGALENAIFQSLIFNIMYIDETGNKSQAIMSLYTQLRDESIILILSTFLVYVVAKWNKASNSKRYFYIGVLLFSVGSYLTSIMSGRAYVHYLMAMVPTLTVPSALLMNELASEDSKFSVALATLISIGLIYYPQIEKKIEDIYVINTPVEQVKIEGTKQEEAAENDRLVYLNQRITKNATQKEETVKVAEIIKENTNPTDEIYVHRQAGNLYLLSDRVSSIKYFNLPAVNINENQLIGEDFLSEFIQSNTEIVVLSTNFNNADKIGIEKSFFDYVIENYELIYDQNDHHIYKLVD